MREPKDAVFQLYRPGRNEIVVPEQRAQERNQPVIDSDSGCLEIAAGAVLCVPAVQVVTDPPVPCDLLLDRERLREAVVGTALARRLKGGNLGQKLGGQDAALDLEGRESEAVARVRHRQSLAMGMRT